MGCFKDMNAQAKLTPCKREALKTKVHLFLSKPSRNCTTHFPVCFEDTDTAHNMDNCVVLTDEAAVSISLRLHSMASTLPSPLSSCLWFVPLASFAQMRTITPSCCCPYPRSLSVSVPTGPCYLSLQLLPLRSHY